MNEKKARSWKGEVIADNSGTWCSNALRFPTRLEAEQNVRDLERRWMLVLDTRVVPTMDLPNYRWDDERRQLTPCEEHMFEASHEDPMYCGICGSSETDHRL